MASNPLVVPLSSLKPFFFKGLHPGGPLFGAVFIGGALRGGMEALQGGLAQAGGAGQVAAGISSVGNQAVTQRLGRALDTRPRIGKTNAILHRRRTDNTARALPQGGAYR